MECPTAIQARSKILSIIKNLIQSLPRYDWEKAPGLACYAQTVWQDAKGEIISFDDTVEQRSIFDKPIPPKYSAIEEIRKLDNDGISSVTDRAILELAEMMDRMAALLRKLVP